MDCRNNSFSIAIRETTSGTAQLIPIFAVAAMFIVWLGEPGFRDLSALGASAIVYGFARFGVECFLANLRQMDLSFERDEELGLKDKDHKYRAIGAAIIIVHMFAIGLAGLFFVAFGSAAIGATFLAVWWPYGAIICIALLPVLLRGRLSAVGKHFIMLSPQHSQ